MNLLPFRFVGPPSEIVIPGGVRIIDAAGKLIIPGGVDPHTHFQLKVSGTVTADDFYHGTKAAVAGGTTTISEYYIIYSIASHIESSFFY